MVIQVRKEYPYHKDFFDADYDWIGPTDFGWYAHLEVPFFMEQTEDSMKKTIEISTRGVQSALENKVHTVIQISTYPSCGRTRLWELPSFIKRDKKGAGSQQYFKST